MRVIYICIIIFLFFGEKTYAQSQNIVSGRVNEIIGGKKQAALGVNVVIMNNQDRFITGTTTDMNGVYRIAIPRNESELYLHFSFIGLKSQTVKYTGQTIIDVDLEEDVRILGEVEVIGQRIVRNDMGLTDRQILSATQRIDVSELVETMPITSIEEALQGQLGGVDIILSGDPGARSSIRIRGTSSLIGSNEPLIVIDGVPYETEIDEDFSFETANEEDFGALLNISPSDIESIEVLKDASATAIWGTEGGNGVLLITTKRGSKGKTAFSFGTKVNIGEEPNRIPMLNGNQYKAMIQDAIWNTANARGLQNSSALLELLFNTNEINHIPSWRYFNEYNQDTDWLSEIRRLAISTDNNFAMSGGGDKATYRFSINYLNEQGTTDGTTFDRLTSMLNITYNFSRKLRFDANFSYVQGERKDSWAGSSGTRSEALRKMPNQSPYYIDVETGERTSEYFTPQENFIGSFTGSANYNPLAMVKDSYSNTTSREGKILFRLYYQILPELSYTGYVSLNLKTTKNKKFLPVSATGVMWTDSYFNMSSDLLSDGQSLVTENKLMYLKNFNNNHNIVATALIRTRESNGSSYSSHTYGNAAPGLSDPTSSGSVKDGGSGDSKSRSMSAIANAHYTLLNRYMFNGTLNLEGNSSMGGDNRYGVFYAVGAGWNIHEENFLREKEWLDMAKIRYSYGKSGKSAGGTAPYLGTFGVVGNYMGMNGIGPLTIQLDNLKWQSSYEHNIGLDLNLWAGKLNFTFDWYTKETVDLLQANYGIPTSTGYSSIKYYNSGKMTNEGFEMRAFYEVFKNRDWRVTVSGNISRNVNKVRELPENMEEENYSFSNGNYATKVIAGDPVGSFYGYRYKGVYQNKEETYARDANGNIMTNIAGNRIIMKNNDVIVYPGDAKYDDVNNDGVINEYDIVYLGNGLPYLTGGAGFSIKYKDITLTTSFHGRFGQKVINRARMNAESMYGKGNQSTAVLRRWRSEGDDTDIPRALYNYGYNYLGSDRFVEKCSYLRLKTLTLNYNLPKQVLQKIGVTRASVFFTGYNLLTWTNYTGQDPEVSLPGSARSLVQDNSQTPVARKYAFGLNINF